MAPRTKERYNAKARQSSVGGSSHKKRRKLKTRRQDDEEGEGSNAVLIDPEMEAARKEADRQRREVSRSIGNDMIAALTVLLPAAAFPARSITHIRSDLFEEAQAVGCLYISPAQKGESTEAHVGSGAE
jgi:hypothetical protein